MKVDDDDKTSSNLNFFVDESDDAQNDDQSDVSIDII